MPEDGYTAMIESILDHERIDVSLSNPFPMDELKSFDHVFYSGPIDTFYGFCFGRLKYRTLDFERITGQGDVQGCAVMNYCDEDVPFTRITEHKHFSPWESHDGSGLFREYSREAGPDDAPYYPVHKVAGDSMLEQYQQKAAEEAAVTFVGRLGTYRYMDMDVTIRAAMDTVDAWLAARGLVHPAH